jgi:hypothetical protein
MDRQVIGFPFTEALSEYQIAANKDGDRSAPATLETTSPVPAFLEKYPSLISLLPEIRRKLRDYFPDSPVSLDVAADPDEADREQLVVAVATHLTPSDAVGRLGQFDRDWWLDNLDRAQGRVCVDVAFG